MSRHDAAYWRKYRRTNAKYRERIHTVGFMMMHALANERYRKSHPEAGRHHYYENIEYYKAKARRFRIAENLRCASDADLAELRRAKQRIYNRKHNDKTRKKPYKEKLSMRIPANVPFGVNPLDRSSPFLRNNMDMNELRSCDNYAMMLAVERKAARRCKE